MKNNNRILSGVFFALTFCWMALIMRMPLINMSLSNSPFVVIMELVALLIFGWVVVKAFASSAAFTCPQKRQLCALSAAYLVLNLVAMDVEVQIIAVTLSGFNQSLASNQALCWGVLAVKFILLAVALCFACVEKKQAVVVFDEGADPAELGTAEAIERLTEQLDEAEETGE